MDVCWIVVMIGICICLGNSKERGWFPHGYTTVGRFCSKQWSPHTEVAWLMPHMTMHAQAIHHTVVLQSKLAHWRGWLKEQKVHKCTINSFHTERSWEVWINSFAHFRSNIAPGVCWEKLLTVWSFHLARFIIGIKLAKVEQSQIKGYFCFGWKTWISMEWVIKVK